MTHWKKLTNPDYLGVYALDDGQDITATIKFVRTEKVIGADGKSEECVVCHFTESIQPMILNTTNMKMITKLLKSPFVEEWAGKKIIIGSEKVKAFGEVVDALRVRNRLPSNEPAPVCSDCGNKIAAFGKMSAAQMADYTAKKYTVPLCADCAGKRAKESGGAE